MDDEYTIKDLLRELLPYLILTAVGTFLATVLFLKFAGHALLGGTVLGTPPSVATFDVIRYSNAQRSVAATFLQRGADHAHASELLNNLPERTRAAIQEVAGPNTLVVLKQSVIQGPAVDITDEVLTRLGLPKGVPTSDASTYALDVAPTMLLAPVAPRRPTTMDTDETGNMLP